jgi:diadenylate cyclase
MSFLVPNLADILDILIVAIIVYGIVIITKRSTGIELISAILVVLVLYFLANIYELKMISGILRDLQNYWFLIIIILFHNEIKSALSRMSKNKSIFSLFRNPVKVTFDPILQSVTTFSETRTGAILVYERTQKLDSYINTGEIIDAKLSTKLLLSLFNPATLLHDGAVIIRNGRLHAAKVVLPLTDNAEYRKVYGTRHLAAIGITEVSDAFCIVISEQTGRISFTKDKEITLDLSVEELLQILTDEAKK